MQSDFRPQSDYGRRPLLDARPSFSHIRDWLHNLQYDEHTATLSDQKLPQVRGFPISGATYVGLVRAMFYKFALSLERYILLQDALLVSELWRQAGHVSIHSASDRKLTHYTNTADRTQHPDILGVC